MSSSLPKKKSVADFLVGADDFAPASVVDESDAATRARLGGGDNAMALDEQNAVGTTTSTTTTTTTTAATTTTTTKPVSFGLNRAASVKSKNLVGAVQLEDDAPRAEPIKAVARDGDVVPLAPKVVVPKVVPLLDSNGELDAERLRAAAVEALLTDASNGAAAAAASSAESVVVVPMLVRNRLKGIDEVDGEDEKFKFDVSRRPDEPSLDNYANMPVEMIGEAMLRGMGWAPGAGVGKSRVVFEPIDFVKRPGRLGLGAKVDDMLPPTHANASKQRIKPGESREVSAPLGALNDDGTFRSVRRVDEQLVALKKRELAVGVQVNIVEGRHAGMGGRIEKLLPDDKAAVRLVSDELVTVARPLLAFLDVVNASNTNSTSSSNATTLNNATSSSSSSSSSTTTSTTSLSSSFSLSSTSLTALNGRAGGLMRRHDSDAALAMRDERSTSSTSSSSSSSLARHVSSGGGGEPNAKKRRVEPLWVRPNIMVRVVSKTFRDGRFYEKKAKVVDW